MGLAKGIVKKTNSKRVILIIGIILVLIAAVLVGKDIYHVIHFDHVESTLKVTRKPKRGYKAYASYEYQGRQYEDKVLSSYNGVVMKDGKSFTILIDPENPDQPQTTSFFLDALFMLSGVACVIVGLKKES